jgi:aldehyde:ferredoxin oxidoreductase
MHVKGLEIPGLDPRGVKSMGFNYVTSNIGASHCYGYATQEVYSTTFPRKVDRFAEEENTDIVILNQDFTAMAEVGIVCNFSTGWGWFPQIFSKMLVAATGIDQFADIQYLRRVGERIINLERAFNVREGFGRKQDTLPQRMLTEPLHTGGALGEGQMIRAQDKFLDQYYEARRWTSKGVPSREKLNELGLSYVLKN